jgi:hypothetical protein
MAKSQVETALARMPKQARESVQDMFKTMDEQGDERSMPNTRPSKWNVVED